MKYFIFSLFLLSFLGGGTFFYSFSLMSGHHVYGKNDFLSYWLYTPDTLKNMPEISSDVHYEYDYDLDSSKTLFIVHWDEVKDIGAGKSLLTEFVKQFNSPVNNDCVWAFHNAEDYSDNYQRYCLRQKNNALELEYFETMN